MVSNDIAEMAKHGIRTVGILYTTPCSMKVRGQETNGCPVTRWLQNADARELQVQVGKCGNNLPLASISIYSLMQIYNHNGNLCCETRLWGVERKSK